MIKLQSSDGEVFQVDFEIAKASETINTMVENLGLKEDDEEIIPLPHVKSNILKKIILWMTHHKDEPLPTGEDDDYRNSTEISDWDQDFLKVDQGTLFEMVVAANYLEITGLLETACKGVANMIKGKTPEEIRKTFNIKNDLTPTEEERIRQENEWCREL